MNPGPTPAASMAPGAGAHAGRGAISGASPPSRFC
ncbi:hypothetical protein JOD97_003874 [Duganella sp. 1411]|nr:hypothetical protein [Duganella sp. 1411]